ncbi:MAG TPA: hypothetical protein VNV36_23115 [Pseudomonas sp.]|uniref:hypothetical protein n=1 Tax=Pseudomonas sp. TaxID=306 RepID=UPI002B709BAD|nr:hypothetical protein [Pseudomonas sp.]HWH89652.1 hypothetical protein [Pseudomonas sp.]
MKIVGSSRSAPSVLATKSGIPLKALRLPLQTFTRVKDKLSRAGMRPAFMRMKGTMMAIQSCIECNGSVSDLAANCPHCGASQQLLREQLKKQKKIAKEKQDIEEGKALLKKLFKFALYISLLSIYVACLISSESKTAGIGIFISLILLFQTPQKIINKLTKRDMTKRAYIAISIVMLLSFQSINSKIRNDLAETNGFSTYSDYSKAKSLNLTPAELAVKKVEWAEEERIKKEEQTKKAADKKAAEEAAEKIKKLVDSVESTCFGAIYDRLKDPTSADFETPVTAPDLKKGVWVVQQFVTSKNSFNANIRTGFQCIVKANEDGNSLVSINKVR